MKYLLVLFGLAAWFGIQPAIADTVTITGNLSSDGTAVGSGDPVITDPSTINIGDPFSLLVNYDPGSFAQTGSSYVLTTQPPNCNSTATSSTTRRRGATTSSSHRRAPTGRVRRPFKSVRPATARPTLSIFT